MQSIIKSSNARARERWSQKRGGSGNFGDDYVNSTVPNSRENSVSGRQQQAKHFKGHVYANIRAIANRTSRQKIVLALRGKAVEKVVGEDRASDPRLKRLTKQYCERNVTKSLQSDVEGAVVIEDHPLAETFLRPNQAMTMYSLLYITCVHLQIHGEAFWLFKNDEKQGPQFWPIPPEWITPDHRNGLFAQYKVKWPGDPKAEMVDGKQIVRFYYPDPSDPITGAYGPLEAGGESVLAMEAMIQTQRISFLRSVNPGLALMVGNLPTSIGNEAEAILTNKQRDKLIQTVMDHYAGFWNDGKPLIFDGFIKDAKRIQSASPRELDFGSSFETVKSQVEQQFGVNPISLGEIEGSNRAASATADDHFLNNVVNPLIDMISMTLTSWVGFNYPVEGKRSLVVFIEQARSVDIDFDLTRDSAMYSAGALSRNEWRMAHGRPPIEDGDNAIVGGALIPIQIMNADAEDPDPQETNEVAYSGPNVKRLANIVGVDGIVRVWDHHEAEMKYLAQKSLGEFFSRMHGFLSQNLTSVLKQHTVLPDSQDGLESLIGTLLDDDAWAKHLTEVMSQHIHNASKTGASIEWNLYFPRREIDYEAKALPIPPRVLLAAAASAATQLGQNYWKSIIKTTRSVIASALIKLGATPQNIGGKIAEALSISIGPTEAAIRSENIAETEIGSAMAGGAQDARDTLHKMNVIYKKKWVSLLDGKERDSHHAAHGQIVDVDGEFLVGGYVARYPKDYRLPPGERRRCRCISVAVTQKA